jgi:molybdopterin/thiamine biosynthesis adenylyltransferase
MRTRDLRVLIVGAGGLGSAAALALADAGVGTIGLCDDDVVDLSNLHRQLLHDDGALGLRKVESAARTLRARAPALDVRTFAVRFTATAAASIVSPFDIILDGSDNLATKFLVNDVCVLQKKPFVIGAALGWAGQVLAWSEAMSAGCYRCLFEEPPPDEPPPSCQDAGIVGPVCGVVGGLQAAAALALVGAGPARPAPRPGRLYQYDGLAGRVRAVRFRRRPGCPVCAQAQPQPHAAESA